MTTLNIDATVAAEAAVEPGTACGRRGTRSASRAPQARWSGWVPSLMAALLAIVSVIFGSAPASAAPAPCSYDTVAYTYDATARLSAPYALVEAGTGCPAGSGAASWVSPVSSGRFGVAANTAADVARPLSQVEARTLTDALRPDKLSHVFDPKHNFGPLVETYGSEAGAMEQKVRRLDGAGLLSSGVFEVTTQVGGQSVVVRGAVVNGVARIGTAFTP